MSRKKRNTSAPQPLVYFVNFDDLGSARMRAAIRRSKWLPEDVKSQLLARESGSATLILPNPARRLA